MNRSTVFLDIKPFSSRDASLSADDRPAYITYLNPDSFANIVDRQNNEIDRENPATLVAKLVWLPFDLAVLQAQYRKMLKLSRF